MTDVGLGSVEMVRYRNSSAVIIAIPIANFSEGNPLKTETL